MNLSSSACREIARTALSGHWIKAIAAALIAIWLGAFCTSLVFVLQFMEVCVIALWFLEEIPHYFLILCLTGTAVALLYFFLGGVLRLGYIDFNLAMLDRRKINLSMLFGKFSMFWKAISARIALFFLQGIASLFLLIPGIVVSYMYGMVPYILEEKSGYTVFRAMRMSRKMMQGKKWKLFCLRISFIGWYLMGFLTLGVGFLYVIPYINTAEAVFFNEVSGRADVFYGRR